MNENKILIAMSGGVDSSVAAFLLKAQGYDCIGATMKLFDAPGQDADETDQARRIADALGIPFQICDLSAAFRTNVIDYFINTYVAGGTPNPCVECNRTMKFGKLLEVAQELGCGMLATGHYARIVRQGDRFLLCAASDATKDQTYVLWGLTQAQLSRTLFPLGALSKQQIREIALEQHFSNAHQKDSQDICFVPDGDYVSFIEKHTAAGSIAGDFVNLDGQVLGRHQGLIRYTIGQRKGLGIAFGTPTYVCAKNVANNTVVLGKNEDLFTKELTAHRINLIATSSISAPIRAEVKVRYSARPAAATVEQTDTDCLCVRFDEPQRAVCSGQSVVLYDGNVVLGGGIID